MTDKDLDEEFEEEENSEEEEKPEQKPKKKHKEEKKDDMFGFGSTGMGSGMEGTGLDNPVFDFTGKSFGIEQSEPTGKDGKKKKSDDMFDLSGMMGDYKG